MSENVQMKARWDVSYFKISLADSLIKSSYIICLVNLICFCDPLEKKTTDQ